MAGRYMGPGSMTLLPQHRRRPSKPGSAGDDLLLSAWAQGDPEAFAALVQRHASALFAAIRRVVGSELAEEVMQDTWLVVVAKITGFEHRGEFGAWLLAIGRNLAKRRARREIREHAVQAEVTSVQISKLRQEDWVGNAASASPDPCQQVLARERLACAHSALGRLSKRDRGLVRQGIADTQPPTRRTGCTSTARVARLRARRRLLHQLDELADFRGQ